MLTLIKLCKYRYVVALLVVRIIHCCPLFLLAFPKTNERTARFDFDMDGTLADTGEMGIESPLTAPLQQPD